MWFCCQISSESDTKTAERYLQVNREITELLIPHFAWKSGHADILEMLTILVRKEILRKAVWPGKISGKKSATQPAFLVNAKYYSVHLPALFWDHHAQLNLLGHKLGQQRLDAPSTILTDIGMAFSKCLVCLLMTRIDSLQGTTSPMKSVHGPALVFMPPEPLLISANADSKLPQHKDVRAVLARPASNHQNQIVRLVRAGLPHVSWCPPNWRGMRFILLCGIRCDVVQMLLYRA